MDQLKFVLYGAGRMGSIHFLNMLTNKRASIHWIVETDVNRAEQLIKTNNMADKVKVFSLEDFEQVLSLPSVDGIMVCTPNDSHAPIIKQALNAGKPVFCEKPLALEFEEIKECYDLANKYNLPLMCAFNRRFDPDFAFLKQKLDNGCIGAVRALYVICRDPKSMGDMAYLKVSGGIFKDSMVHQIDLANHVIGETPITVYATGHASHAIFLEINDVDTAKIILKYPSGALATLELSRWADINHDQRLEVLGTTGMLQAVNKRPLGVVSWDTDGVHQEPIYEGLERYNDAYKNEVDHFIDAMKGICELQVTSSSTMTSFIIAAACKISHKNDQVVQLSEFAKSAFNYDL